MNDSVFCFILYFIYSCPLFFLLLESAKFILVEYMQGAQKLAVATENKYKRHW